MPMMHLSSNGERIAQGIEFNGNALAIAQFKTPSSPIPNHGQPSN
jgi:hypothetical protein